MKHNPPGPVSRREFLRLAGLATVGAGASMLGAAATPAQARTAGATPAPAAGKPYNILMIVTDQERYFTPDELPAGYRLPGHVRLAQRAVIFENHQVASCVCTPSRAVIYTGRHIQNNGVFDNVDFPWSSDLSPEIPTIGALLREAGYYTAFKGKWHLAREFETINTLHAPKEILTDEMEQYGFADYFGIGDIIASTAGGYMHDEVITAMARSWLRGQAAILRQQEQPWFMAVNLINPHDVMYYNTDLPGQTQQSHRTLMQLNRDPRSANYRVQWPIRLPPSRHQPLDEPGRPLAHHDFKYARGALVGVVPNEDPRWERLNNYYLNCIRDVDHSLEKLLEELDHQGMTDNTIVIYTADHGELAGAHGLSGKGATAYREQINVPFMIAHPDYPGNKRCRAVTSHLDIAPTLISMAGGDTTQLKELHGKDITPLLTTPEQAPVDALRPGALYNYNMLAYLDQAFLNNIADFFADGGKEEDLPNQDFRPVLAKRGAIRTIYDGRYKFSRYFSPKQHHVPLTFEVLFANNDVELFDLKTDPREMNNLARDPVKYGDLCLMMNNKLNLLIEQEVGEDVGQMLPGGVDANWRLSPRLRYLRM